MTSRLFGRPGFVPTVPSGSICVMPTTAKRPTLPALLLLLVTMAAAVAGLRAEQTLSPFDVLIAGGRIVDGTGAPWFKGDIAISGDRIVAVGQLAGRPARQVVDAAGFVVAPGFIDLLGQSEFNVLVDGRAASKIMQGVTTEITGEGESIAPVNDRMVQEAKPAWDHFQIVQDFRTLAEYFQRLETRSPAAINIGTFVGSGGVRRYVIGSENVPSTPATLERMKALVADAMKDGALGLSSSLQYVPDRFNTTDDLVELAKVARSYGGIYLTHIRSESGQMNQALDEVFRKKPGDTAVRLRLEAPRDFSVLLDVPVKVRPDKEFRAAVEAICGAESIERVAG